MKAWELIQLLKNVPPETTILLYDEENDILPVLQATQERADDRRYRKRVPPDTTEKFILIV